MSALHLIDPKRRGPACGQRLGWKSEMAWGTWNAKNVTCKRCIRKSNPANCATCGRVRDEFTTKGKSGSELRAFTCHRCQKTEWTEKKGDQNG